MARDLNKLFDSDAARKRVIRQRNIVLGSVLAFFALLFFAITVVKMKHIQLPHKSPQTGQAISAGSPASGTNHD